MLKLGKAKWAKGRGQRQSRTAKPARQFEVGTVRPTSGHFGHLPISLASAKRLPNRQLDTRDRLAVRSLATVVVRFGVLLDRRQDGDQFVGLLQERTRGRSQPSVGVHHEPKPESRLKGF